MLVGSSEAGLRVYPLRIFEVVEPFWPAGGRPQRVHPDPLREVVEPPRAPPRPPPPDPLRTVVGHLQARSQRGFW